MTFETKLDTSGLSELGRAAVWYCENGFAIIPLGTSGESRKHPITKNGLNDWFNDPDDAKKLWGERPNLNIAIVCGKPSGNLTVFDFDEDDEKGVHGFDTLAEWEDENGELTSTATAVTGRGGMHYLYRDTRSYRPSVNGEMGVDIRSEGSYIVAPPSVHPNGRKYSWNKGDEPWVREVASMGANERALLDHVQRNGGMDQDSPRTSSTFKLPQRIKSGNRNDTLYRYGCSLRTRGYPDDAIDAMLRRANETNCVKPMPESEISTVIRQVCKRGPGYDGMGTFRDDDAGLSRPSSSSGSGGISTDESDIPNFRTSRGAIQHNLLAQVMIERNHACVIDGMPAIWTGKRWEFGKSAICRAAISYADDIKKSVRDEVYSYIVTTDDNGLSSERSFDGRYYIQFADATYDVMSGITVDPTPDMLIIGTLPINLNLDAPYGLADKFLESLANYDRDVETVLAEIVGACMCARRAMTQSPMLIGKANVMGGEASNGKSTYLSVLRALLGPNNISSLDIATLGQRFQAARIIGKLANLGDDIPDGFLHGDELSVFKKLVTGEQIYSDIKNSDGVEFTPNATMVFSMNAMPRLADTTDGVFRRLAFIPFRNKFAPGTEGFDPYIKDKMCQTENLERLAVLGLMALPDLIQRRTLTKIPGMDEEVERIRIDNDVVRRWIVSECVEESDLDGQWLSDVYEMFREWTKKAGENPVKQDTFKSRLLAVSGRLEAFETRDRAANKRGIRFKMSFEHSE